MKEKQSRQFQQEYDEVMESAGLMTGRKLQKLLAASEELQRIVYETAYQKGGRTAVKPDDIRNRTGTRTRRN